MKTHCKQLATTLAALLAIPLLAAVPIAWTNSPGMPPYAVSPIPHGSMIDFSVTLKGYTSPPIVPGADLRLWYQTNGMGSAWFYAPASINSNVITATFGPAQDVGADRVSLFFGAPSNVFASAVLRLTPSPGFAPNSLPFPAPVLDFSTVDVRNIGALTNGWSFGIATDLSPSTNYTDRALSSFAATGTVARAHTYGTLTRWTDANGDVWEAGEKYPSSITLAGVGEYQYIGSAGGVHQWGPDSVHNYISFEEGDDRWTYYNDQSGVWIASHAIVNGEQTVTLQSAFSGSEMQISYVSHVGETNLVGRVALTTDITAETDPTVPEWAKEPAPPSYSAADVGAAPASIVPVLTTVSNAAETAKLNAETALRIVLGESVWFAVTNYMRTVEGVIPSLQLWEVRDSATNLVYDSREEITNTVRVLTSELRAELEARIPSKAWGNYQSDGTDNPEPGKVAIVNQPTVILTGGGTFNKYVEIGDSSIWVLTSSGPVSFGGGGANGNFFAVLDDEGNAHFKVSKTDSFDVPAIFSDNPRKSGDALLLYICSTNRQGEAYNGPPTLSACTNLQEAVWHDETEGEIDALGTSVAWSHNDAINAWVGSVTQDRWATTMFFRAKIKQEGGTAIINTAPARFDGGVQIGNTIYYLAPYTTGGKTYLTLETTP